MKCPICNINELQGKQQYCSATCRKRASRSVTPTVTKESVTQPSVTDYWATRPPRTKRIKTGYVSKLGADGTLPDIYVPQQWTLDDIDQAIKERDAALSSA